MTLKRRFIFRQLALLAGLCVLAAASLWGLTRLRDQLLRSVYLYEQLASIAPAEVELASVHGELSSSPVDRDAVVAKLDRVIERLDRFTTAPERAASAGGQSYSQQKLAAANVLARVRPVREALAAKAQASADHAGAERSAAPDPAPHIAEVRIASEMLRDVCRSCDELVRMAQETASRQVRATMLLIALLGGIIFVTAAVLSFLHYRGLIVPLQKLRRAVRSVAAGNFADRCDENARELEIAELAREFNRMAGELDEFYKRLELKVQQASKDLVRSERLASVGFLAAGVAHEINNPLSIISGYAELSLRSLRERGADAKSIEEAEAALGVIRDEAFRCKGITEKLLSLSRGGHDANKQTFSLAHVAEDVTSMLAGLKNYRDRRVELKLDGSESLDVIGRPDEMKQVILNLAVNALEAVPPGGGEVQIDGRRTGAWVELCVRDNGRGMAAEVLDHVFEPFFTVRPGNGRREHGTGLGLSITHAIVESHGGEIRAESEGIGRGSRFVVRLPAANRN